MERRVRPRSLPFILVTLVSLALAGCVADEVMPADAPVTEVETDAASLRPIEASFTGSVSGTPLEAGVEEFFFEVPQGAVGINGTLTWASPVARMGLELVDPYGELVETGYPAQDGMLVVATVEPPASGKWTFRVLGELPAPVDFTLAAVAELIVPADNEVVKTIELRGGAGFYEVNMIMEENATFTFSFNATEPINWDVHSHPESGVKYWQEGTDASAAGSFTAPERGIYSILFHNENPLPVDMTFELRGAFRLHSHAQ